MYWGKWGQLSRGRLLLAGLFLIWDVLVSNLGPETAFLTVSPFILISLRFSWKDGGWGGVSPRKDRRCVCKGNIEARSRKPRCCEKAICITYSQCVSVALVIQHKKSMGRIILSSVAWWFCNIFFANCKSQTTRFSGGRGRRGNGHEMFTLIFSTNLSKTFLILRRTERDMIKNVCRSSCKVAVIIVRL